MDMVKHLKLGGTVTPPSHRKYNIKFHNVEVEAMVTHDPSMVDSWITETLIKNETRLHRLIVGLDVEWKPTFTKGCPHCVAVLQLCVGRSCLIYQIHRSEKIPPKLRDFLENGEYTFVGDSIREDSTKLRINYELRVGQMIDISLWAAQELEKEELGDAGLKQLVKEVVGEEMDKPSDQQKEMDKPKSVACSRWDVNVLTEKQVAYACADAYYSFEVGRRLSYWYN